MADENPQNTPDDDRRRPKGAYGWMWIAVPIILLILVGIVAAITLGSDDSEPVGAGSPEPEMVDTQTGPAVGSDLEGEDGITDPAAEVTDTEAGGETAPPAGDTGTTGDTGTAPSGDDAATTGEAGAAPVGGDAPAAVREDPVVQRLARGRDLPFTAGPWRQRAWRDNVYSRLRPQTQARAERVRYRNGFGIRLR